MIGNALLFIILLQVCLLKWILNSANDGHRNSVFANYSKILCEEDVVVIPLFYDTVPVLVKPRVKGWYHMPIGGQHIRDWFLEE